MEVICIGSRKYTPTDKRRIYTSDTIFPVEGRIYTVIDAKVFYGILCYQLKEIPKIQQEDIVDYWDGRNFAPLDTFKQDEIESELSEIFKETKEPK